MGKFRENSFDASKLLPPNIVIKSAANHFYEIGLSLFQLNSENRSKLSNPLFIFVIHSLIVIRSFVSIFLSEENEDIFIVISDFTHFLRVRIHFNIAVIVNVGFNMISQLIHCWNYYKDISPTYLKPFEMMSGLVSPKSIDLSNREEILKWLKRSKLLFKLSSFILNGTIFLASFLVSFLTIVVNCSVVETIIYGIPWSLAFAFSTHCAISFTIWQLVYFYLINYYIKVRINHQNQVLRSQFNQNNKVLDLNSTRRKILRSKMKQKLVSSQTNISQVLKSLNNIYKDISEYNNIYWSKFLFWFWTSYTFILGSLLYEILFRSVNILIRLAFIYAFCLFVTFFTLFITIASSTAAKAYETNKLFYSYIKFLDRIKSIEASRKLKVFQNISN